MRHSAADSPLLSPSRSPCPGTQKHVPGNARHDRLRARLALAINGAMAVILVSGCASLAPTPPTPPAPIPQAWLSDVQPDKGRSAPALGWNDYFTDPLLQRLIQTALENNRDLRSAVLRVEEARATFQIQRSGLLPEVGLGAQAARARIPGDLNTSGRPITSEEYRAQVGISSWELDLWGRVRSLNDAALQQWLATEAGSRAARTALIAQVADGYLGVRELQERVSLARHTVESQQESLRIFTRRFEVGATAKLEVMQVQVLLTQAQTLLAQLEQAKAVQGHALGLLVGADPGLLPVAAPFDETTVLAELAPGLPSDLLTARPDILAAEHRLAAANANIGAARAAFFPRIALTASFGTASTELDGLFSPGSRAWTFAPVVSLPIFDGGRRQANLDVSQVRRDIAVAEYEKSIQTAFREVSDALSARRWLTEQRDVQRIALGAASERARLAKLRYDNGSAAYLEVLDAQRDLLAAEQQLVQTRRQLLSSQVALYTALGGGARVVANTPTSATSAPATPDKAHR